MMGSTSRNEVLVFYERAPLSDVFLPIKTTARVKYTCFDISRKYLALGATSGSVYIFNREPLHFLQAIVNNEGLLEGICIGPHENILAIATCKGSVVLVEFTWEQSSFVFRRIFSSYDHRDSHVTYLKWSPNGSRLFVGDDKGKVTVITFTLSKAVPLLQPRTALVAKLESAVVQLDFALEKILISTLNWCYLCDTEREQYSSIGKKPREGAFGSCFYTDAKLENPLIYSARPGSRIWEVDFEGNVLCTHQLKKSLAQAPACLILYNEPTKFAAVNDFWPPQSLNFKKLVVIGKDHLLACTADSIFIFEPSDVVDVVLWCKLPQTINDIRADRNDIYIRYESGNMQKLQVLVVERCVRDLLERGLWNESAKLCLNYELPVIDTRARRVLPYSMMKLLADRLDDEQLRSNIQSIVNKLQLSEKQECLERTREGIFVVSRGQRRFDWEDDADRTINDRESPARHFWSGFRPISPYHPVVPVKVEECQSTPQFRHLRRKSEDLDQSAVTAQFSNSAYESQRSPNSISRSLSCGNWKLGTPDNEGMDGVKNTPGIFFEDFRQSVSAKVTSGTFKILRTMGDIEDRFKVSLASSIPELLDVDVGNETGKKFDGYNSRNDTSSYSESVVCLPPQSSSTGDVPKSVIIGSYDTPNIDLDDFLAETISAWKWLENSEVFDILRTKETLSRWVGSINRVQAACNSAILEQLSIGEAKNSTVQNDTDWSSNVHEVVKSLASFHWWETNEEERQEDKANYRWIFMQDWMQLSAEVQSQVSRLTIACFQCNVFGEIGEKLSRRSSFMQNHLLVFGNGLLKMIKNGIMAAAAAASEEPWHQDENEDDAQSVFIAQYLHLVKAEDFHRCLACQRHDVFRSWGLLMDAAKESILHTGGDVERILALLGALSGKRCNRRQALKVAESISPRDIIYSLQRVHFDRSTLLVFMEALWNRPSYRTMRWGLWDVKEVLELHPNFYLYWVTNLLQDDHNSPVGNFKCSRGLPRPLSNHHPWKWKSLLCQIFNEVKHDKLQENFTQLCLQFGFWSGYLILLRRASERDKLLQTLMYLDDKLLLESQELGYVPESADEWGFVLQLTLRMADDTLACDKRTLNFEEVAKLMVKFLPVTQAIKVLQKVHENTSTSNWKLSHQFYLSCIMQQIARQKYKSMTQLVLENTASHLWTQRSIAGPPQVVEEMLKEEREPSSNHNIQSTKFLDNLQCHWGISLDLTKDCAFCQQPLAKASSSRGYLGGVVVFICGHALHQLCSCDDICCMCQVPKSMQRPEA